MANNFGAQSKPMNFGESISTCLKKYAVFEGRASKSEFWYFYLLWLSSFILIFIPVVGMPIFIIITFGGLLPSISVTCRRLHDINKSGWWQLIPLYFFILCTLDSSEGVNQSRSTRSSNNNNTIKNISTDNDLIDELEELEELYKDGTLSEAQFKKAKNKLLK